RQAERLGNVFGDRLDFDSEPATVDRAVLDEVADDRLGGRSRNGEGDADISAGRREDGRIDPDDLAAQIERRTTRVAAVHCRIDLDEVVIGARADVTTARRNDAGGDRSAEAEGIANRDDPIANPNRRVVGKVNIGEVPPFAVYLEHGEIRPRIGADQLGVEFVAIVHDHGEGTAFLDHMVVGDEVAVTGNEEAGTLCYRTHLVAVSRWAGAVLIAETRELPEEAAQIRIIRQIVRTEGEHPPATIGRCLDIRLHADANNGGRDLFDHVREA